MTDVFNWRIINPLFYPTYYEVGIYTQLDERGIRRILDSAPVIRDDILDTEDFIFSDLAMMQDFLDGLIAKTQLEETDDSEELSIKNIISPGFTDVYHQNVRKCVSLVQWVRKTYSNCVILCSSLSTLERPHTLLADTLRVREEDLKSLESYCKSRPLSRALMPQLRILMDLTNRIEDVFRREAIPTITEDNIQINWYRACLPGIKSHVNFCLEWGKDHASFGELSLPEICSNQSTDL